MLQAIDDDDVRGDAAAFEFQAELILNGKSIGRRSSASATSFDQRSSLFCLRSCLGRD